jgi:phenylpyruvate tautomerase PptA (4-oxalocrotonate tautomerase family)
MACPGARICELGDGGLAPCDDDDLEAVRFTRGFLGAPIASSARLWGSEERPRMPSLQLDVPATYGVATKRALANRLGAVYADVMQTRPDIVTVAIRDLGEGSVWRCGDEDPRPGALLMCDIRRGRPVAMRAELSRQLIAVCVETLDLDPQAIKVEFTQHSGDEMYHPHLGGFNQDWEGDESGR